MNLSVFDVSRGVEWLFPTRYARTRKACKVGKDWLCETMPEAVDRRYGVVTFLFDRLDDLEIALTTRATEKRIIDRAKRSPG